MSQRRVVYTRRAERDLLELPPRDRIAIIDALGAWAAGEPYVDVEKLADIRPPRWRIRVGPWRALADRPEADLIRILRVLSRKDAYR